MKIKQYNVQNHYIDIISFRLYNCITFADQFATTFTIKRIQTVQERTKQNIADTTIRVP